MTTRLKEFSGDFSMSGLRRMEAPGNMRGGIATSGGRNNVLDDESAELDKRRKQIQAMPRAAAAYVAHGGKVLAVSRFEDDFDLNMPGGSIEPGEDSAVAAARELWEETGIVAHELHPVFTRINNGVVVTTYKVTKFSGRLRPTWEGKPSWEDPEVLIQSRFGKYFKAMLASLDGKDAFKK